MPLVEAMASHTPIVATRGGAFPEIVEDGRSGLLVERGDAQALAGAILQLLSNPRQRIALAQAGYERASMFTLDRTVEDLLKEYGCLFARDQKSGCGRLSISHAYAPAVVTSSETSSGRALYEPEFHGPDWSG